MPFNATADGSVSAGTCSLTEDCQAGPNSAIPLPTTKHSPSRICGVTRPSHDSTVKVVAPDNAIASEISATMRRSCMSAMAPAGIEISITGSIRAVCTNATLSADDVICVIAQAAPTAWIISPRLDSRLASQMRRNTEYRSGAVMPSAAKLARSDWSAHDPSRLVRPRSRWRLIPVERAELMPANRRCCPVLTLSPAVSEHGQNTEK